MRWLTVMVSTGSPPHDALKLPTRISSMCPETSQKQCYYSLAAHPEHATPRHVTRQSSQPTGCFSASSRNRLDRATAQACNGLQRSATVCNGLQRS